jgi:hypothetical protein
MLILSVSLYLFLIGWIILLLHRINKKSGINWLISVLTGLIALFAWGGIGFLQDVSLQFDLSTSPLGTPAVFSIAMDSLSRGMGVLGLAYLVFILNSWMIELDQNWIFTRIKNIFLYASIFLFLISAQNLFTYLVFLIFLDSFEFLQRIIQIRSLAEFKPVFASLILRFFGAYLFFIGWLLSENTSIASVHSLEVLVIAMLLRLWSGLYGVKPLKEKKQLKYGSFEEIILFLLGQLIFFIRFPLGNPLPVWMHMLATIAVILMVYHLVQWLREKARYSSIMYFLQFQMIFLIFYCQAGTQAGFLSVIFAALLVAAIIYFRPINHRYYRWFMIPIFALLLGLPYLPTSSLWGIQDRQYMGLYLFYCIYILGIRSRYEQQTTEDVRYERWMLAIYPVGYLPFILGLVYLVVKKELPIQVGQLWISIAAAAGTLLFFLFEWLRYKKILKFDESAQWIASLFDVLWKRFGLIFQRGWVLRILRFFSKLLQRAIQFITNILEGDGGLLWSIVLLILFLSMIRTVQGK